MPSEDGYFKKGGHGNPGGSPKGKRISTWMVELGQMGELPDPDTLPVNGRIAHARLKAAMGEDGERSTEIVLDRTEMKQPETVVQYVEPHVREMILQKGRELGKSTAPIANA